MTGYWLLVGSLVSGLIGLAIGKARQQSPVKCFILCAALGFIGWLLILISRPDDAITKQCPACLARVPVQASACRHCGRDLPEAALLAESVPVLWPWYAFAMGCFAVAVGAVVWVTL